jgi:hypothetical protein
MSENESFLVDLPARKAARGFDDDRHKILPEIGWLKLNSNYFEPTNPAAIEPPETPEILMTWPRKLDAGAFRRKSRLQQTRHQEIAKNDLIGDTTTMPNEGNTESLKMLVARDVSPVCSS